jgi:predicted TIM-barrel fold metal-dependent hydrolase
MIELFDAQAGFGGGRRGDAWIPTAEEWIGHMDRLSIARALVRTDFEEMDTDPVFSNRLLFEACARHDAMVPCPVVLPRGHGDVPQEREQIDELLARGSGAVTLRPGQDGWSTAEWCAGTLFDLLEERRIPVLCRSAALGFDAVADLAGRHPRLPIVLFHLGYRTQRMLFALLKAFANISVSVGSPYSVHRGLEMLVRQVGPERLLFGSGFPDAEPTASITMLAYSSLSEADKQLVGSGNLDRLIKGIRR